MGNRQELERVIVRARKHAFAPDDCRIVLWKNGHGRWEWFFYVSGFQYPRPHIVIDVSRGTGRSRDLAKIAVGEARLVGLLPLPHDMMSRAEAREAASHE